MTNFLGIAACANLPVRDEPPTVLEYTAAEYWIRRGFGAYWMHWTRPRPRLMTWQLERFWTKYEVYDDVVDLVMDVLGKDFRNALSPRLVADFKRLLKSGGSATALLDLLKEIGPGGYLKPDMLGIAAPSTGIELEGLEVGTVKTAKSTYDELQHKLSVLRDTVVPELKVRLPVLSMKLQMSVPSEITVRASPWRPSQWDRILPLPVRVSKAGKVRYVDWICYHPTMTWRDSKSPPVKAEDLNGEDGLVIYHIHRLPAPSLEVPPRVRAEIEAAIRRYKQQSLAVLELNPAYAYSFKADRDAFSPEVKQMFAYIGAGALLLVVLGVAWEVGMFAGAAYIAEAGLEAAVSSMEGLGGALSWAAKAAADLWPQMVTATPLVLSKGR